MITLGTNVNIKPWSSTPNGDDFLLLWNDEPRSGIPNGGGSFKEDQWVILYKPWIGRLNGGDPSCVCNLDR